MTFQAVLGTLDLTGLDASGVQWTVSPDIDGWSGTTTSTIQAIQKPRQSGAWAGDAFGGARHISISGKIFAPTQDLLTAAFNRLNSAVSLSNTTLTITEGTGAAQSMTVRREDRVIPQYITDTIANYSIQLLAVDGRKFLAPLVQSATEFATSGGLTVPFTVPFTISSTVSSGLITLTNTGNETGPVLARIDGPAHSPIITHVGSSGTQVFSMGLNLVAGEYLLIDMEKRTVYANGTASRSGYITSRGWSTFDPGVNTWSFSAVSFDAAALLTITATPANK